MLSHPAALRNKRSSLEDSVGIDVFRSDRGLMVAAGHTNTMCLMQAKEKHPFCGCARREDL